MSAINECCVCVDELNRGGLQVVAFTHRALGSPRRAQEFAGSLRAKLVARLLSKTKIVECGFET